MRYRIKSRLADLGKRNLDVIKEIKRRGVNCNPSDFSSAIHGKIKTEKADLICEVANDIISEWEDESKTPKNEFNVFIIDRDEIIRQNIYNLGYPKDCTITYGDSVFGRVEVFVNGERIGIWDDAKRTFVN